MICRALTCTDEGATRQFIKKYLITNYKIDPNSPHLKRAIRQLINAQDGEPRLYTKGKKKGTYYASEELENMLIRYDGCIDTYAYRCRKENYKY